MKSRIEDHWSPEQIANRKTAHKVPSTSTIYRMIHQKRPCPVTMARLRKKGSFTGPAETRGKFNDGGRTIKNAPKMSINEKNQDIGRVILLYLVKLIASANLQPVL